MNKKTFVIFFVFLLFISLADAAKVTQTFTGTTGLEIKIPQAEYVKQNEDIQSNIHIFNLSSGILMTNVTTTCLFHIYNKSGNHIASEDMDYEDTDDDFYLNIDGNNFSELGFLSFIIQCNTSNEGGFVSGSVIVTESGEVETEARSIKLIAALLGLLIIAGLFLVFAFKLDEEHYIIKIFFMIMSLITLTVIPQVIIKGLSYAEENLTKIPLWAFYIFAIYVFFYIFYNWARKSERFVKWFGSQK